MKLFERILTSLDKKIKETDWTDVVKTKWTPPEGTFSKDTPAEKTADIVCKGHKNLKSAVSSVNFYFNRLGDSSQEQRRDKIINILHKICSSKEAKVDVKTSKVEELNKLSGNEPLFSKSSNLKEVSHNWAVYYPDDFVPPEDLLNKDVNEIAKILCNGVKDKNLQLAVVTMNFFVGKNQPTPEELKKSKEVIKLLHKICKEPFPTQYDTE